MPHGHSLVQQTSTVDAIALGTLAGRTALALNTSFGAITQSFLLTRIRYMLQLVGRTLADDGPIIVGVANGDASIAEISAAMIEGNIVGMNDVTQTLTQDNAWVVYQNTVRVFQYRGDGTEAVLESDWVSFGGKNGIPAQEDSGWQIFAFNCGSGALATGSSINGLCQAQGVWLRD